MTNLKLELQFQQADLARLQTAWQSIINRHELLQSYINTDGQFVKANNTEYKIKLYDLSLQNSEKINSTQQTLRDSQQLTNQQWPWFSVNAASYDSGDMRLYCAFANDMLSAEQIHYLLRELLALYQNPDIPLNSIELVKPEQSTKTNQNAFTLRYRHLFGKLDHQTLASLREKSIEHHISLPVTLLNTFYDELEQQNYSYPVLFILANRYPIYPFMYDRACFATSVAGRVIKNISAGNFVENCQQIDSQFRHDSASITQENIKQFVRLPENIDALALFSCTIEQDLPAGPLFATMPDIIYCNFNLPSIDIDFNVWEQGGQLLYRWSYAKALPAIDTSLENSLLRNAIAANPELKEIIADNETANSKNIGKAVAGTGAIMAGTAGASKAKNKQQKTKNATLPLGTKSIKQSNEHNSALDKSFEKYGHSLHAIANSPHAWQAGSNSTQEANPQQTQQNPYSEQAIGASSAAGLLGLAIEQLKNSDLSPSDPPQAPSTQDLDSMTPEQTEQAFDNYCNDVIKMHRAPSKSDLAQTDMCAQFTNLAGELGPNIEQVKSELTAMGSSMDKVSADIAKGDIKAAAAGLDQLSGDRAQLSNKIDAAGIPASVDETPLGQAAESVYNSSASINENSSPDDIANLNDKVDVLEKEFVAAQSQMTSSDKTAGTNSDSSALDELSNTPEFQSMQSNTENVKKLGQEVAQYDCDSISKQASQEKIASLKQQAEELEKQIPIPSNPLDEDISNAQSKADAVKARAEQLKGMTPDMAMQDPQLISALDDLNASADNLANNVQGQCPICSASNPNLPAIPKCGHNHKDVLNMTNPFHKPQVKLTASNNMLNKLKLPTLSPVLDKMKSLQNKMQSAGSTSSNATNPYTLLLASLNATKQRVTSLTKNLANCPDSSAQTQQLSNIESTLNRSEKKITDLVQNNSSDNTQAKFSALKDQMAKQTFGKANGMTSDIDRQRQKMLTAAQSGAMAKVTASFACYQAMNMPKMAGGKPDEILVSGFKCKCPSAIGGPVPVMLPPSATTESNGKKVLIINGIPLTANMGQCIHIDKTKPIPCVSTLLAAGGSKVSSSMKFPIATLGTTKITCPLGAQIKILDSGQNSKDPATTP